MSYSSNRADALKAHKVKQHGLIIPDEEMVPCTNAPECKQKFITQEKMRQHYRLICQKQGTVTCPHSGCDRTFKNQTQMKSHFKSHTAEKKEWYCSQCQKQFSSKQSYSQHMTRHNSEVHEPKIMRIHMNMHYNKPYSYKYILLSFLHVYLGLI